MANSYEVGNLYLEITSDSKEAVKGLEGLKGALGSLSTSLTSLGSAAQSVTSLFSALEKLSKMFAGFDTKAFTDGISSMTTALDPLIEKLKSLNTLKDITTVIQRIDLTETGGGTTGGDPIGPRKRKKRDVLPIDEDEPEDLINRYNIAAKTLEEMYEALSPTVDMLGGVNVFDTSKFLGKQFNRQQTEGTKGKDGQMGYVETYLKQSVALKELGDRINALILQYNTMKSSGAATKEQLAEQAEKVIAARSEYDKLAASISKLAQGNMVLKSADEQLTIAQYESEVAARKQHMQYLQIKAAQATGIGESAKYRAELKAATKEFDKLNRTAEKTGKKTGLAKLWERISNISVWRMIRYALRQITQIIAEGVNDLAQFDDTANATMSQLSSSYTVIKASVGTVLMPLLEAITPIVQGIAEAFANLANTVSAAMSTTGTYTKINTDYLKDYASTLQSTANLFSFDKFETMSGNDSLSGLFSTEVVDEEDESVQQMSETLGKLTSVLSDVWVILQELGETLSPLFSTILDIASGILSVIDALLQGISPILSWISNLGGLTEEGKGFEAILWAIVDVWLAIKAFNVIKSLTSFATTLKTNVTGALNSTTTAIGLCVAGIASMATGIVSLVSNWDNMSTAAKVLVPTLSVLAGVIVGVVTALLAIKYLGVGTAMAIVEGIALGAAVTGIGLSVGSSLSSSGYAEGGLPDKYTMFYAGESGPELVYSAGGNSAVANVEQLAQAVAEGIVSSGLLSAAQQSASKEMSVSLDGAEIARSTSFKREAKRIHLGIEIQ